MKCATESFTGIIANITGARINYAASVAQNGSFGDAATNLAFPFNATNLPALCAVSINVKSSANSSYNLGVFLPQVWNGRMMTTGNGGYGGGISWPDMGALSRYGFATVSTDTGHSSSPVDGKWALNQPERLIDWGYRAMHGSVVTAKQVVAAFYGEPIKYSYYSSCSTGGRQGLKEIQLHPDSFDGISVGAPAWWFPNLPSATLKQGLYNLPADGPGHIPPSLFPAIVAEMVKQCDPQDGLRDGIISDPFGCNFDFDRLLCVPGRPANASSCLTSAQLHTASQFYHDFVDTNQTFVFPAVSLGVDPTFLLSAPSTLGSDYYRYWVHNDSSWDFTGFTYADVQLAQRIDPGQATPDAFGDMTAFMRRGGKLLQYHGLADNLIPTRSSLVFYDGVYRALAPRGVTLDDFYRLFLIPGMQHCSGADVAPWYIAGAGQTIANGAAGAIPGLADPRHDVVLALMRWVEQGVAPDTIVATKFRGDDVAQGVLSQRPVCVYPKQARYNGTGDPSAAESWKCEPLY